jgi:hypothetical protein
MPPQNGLRSKHRLADAREKMACAANTASRMRAKAKANPNPNPNPNHDSEVKTRILNPNIG